MKSAEKRAQWSALIVDDEPLARASLRTLLEREPDAITILEARNGHEAASLILGERPDVVFLDVQMPEMNGFEATAAIREREGQGPRLPIVAMTAHAMAGDRERCLDAGMDGYVTKPVHRETLIGEVERLARDRAA